MNDQFDAIIIGSGAGGAPIAHILAKAGKSVLVLEKGPLIRPQGQTPNGRSEFRRDELISDGPEKKVQLPVANNGQSYYSSHVEPDLNDEPHVYRDGDGSDKATLEGYTAQLAGGGTQLYGGVSFRFSPLDFRLATFNSGRTDLKEDPNNDIRREARDWPVQYSDMEPYYTKTEELVGINGTVANQQKPFSRDVYQPPLTPNGISEYARRGMELLAKSLNNQSPILPYRTPLAVITRDHAPSGRTVPADPESAKTSYVNRYGDPLGLKSSTWVSLLTPVKDKPNFTIRCNSVATRLTYLNGKVDRVFYLDPAGVERSAQGKVVVVACSAIESIRLLKLSATLDTGFDKAIHQNDLLGRYFMTHCFGGASALLPDRYDKSIALDADWATDCCATEAFLKDKKLWAAGALYNNTSDEALPMSMLRTYGAMDLDNLWDGFMFATDLKAKTLVNFFDDQFGRGLSVSFMANQVPQRDNRIELHPNVKDKWNRPVAYILKQWHAHDRYLMDTYAEMADEILRLAGAGDNRVRFIGKGGSYLAPNGIVRIANHILGGARFGNDRNDSVLDVNCRAWDFDNLFVTDGAFMPTSGSGNPTNTIEANSFRVADQLLTRL
ncbi:MAG: GMC family oxidoreductase [Acidobacteriota bacterium]|nr:GMC family oxidoreductase [Acidobacteriota bacterium]